MKNIVEQLRAKAVASVWWSLLDIVLIQLLSFIQIIVAARILQPQDFGIIAISILVIELFEFIFSFGIKSAVIQKKDVDNEYLCTAWTLSLILGIIIYFIVYALSAPIAIFFNEHLLAKTVKFVGLSLVLQSMLNVGVINFERNLDFKKYFYYNSISALLGFIAAICLLLILKSFWALVYAYVFKKFSLVVLSYVIHPFRPKFKIVFGKLKEIGSFGTWVSLDRIVGFSIHNIVIVIIGRLLGAYQLGIYQLANKVSNFSLSEVKKVFFQVGFPLLSKLQSDKQQVKMVYLETLESISMFTFPFILMLILLSYNFVDIFLGPKWLSSVVYIRILALISLLRAFTAPLSAVILAINKQKVGCVFNIVQLFLIIIFSFLVAKEYGLLGVSFVILMSVAIVLFFAHSYFYKILKISFRDLYVKLKSALFSSLFMAACISFINEIFVIDNYFNFIIVVLFGICLYVISLTFVFKYDFKKYLFISLTSKKR